MDTVKIEVEAADGAIVCLIIDRRDRPILEYGKLFVRKNGYNYYAAIYADGKERPLHRIIAHEPLNMHVHHINHDTLDNRRCNLAIISKSDHKYLHSKLKTRHYGRWNDYVRKAERERKRNHEGIQHPVT